jgi:hypothetical protein
MRAGDNLDVGASFDQALVKPNKRRSILDPVITCDPRGSWILPSFEMSAASPRKRTPLTRYAALPGV